MSKVQKTKKKIRKKSNCWLFYTRSDKGGTCRLCQKEIISSGNTTNLLNHLKRKHSVQWESALELNEDDSDNMETETDEDVDDNSNEPPNPPDETHQTHGLAYQSSDGRTVIWLHPDVQIDQLSAAGFQPQITLIDQPTENVVQGVTTMVSEEKEGEAIFDVRDVSQKKNTTTPSSEDVQKVSVSDSNSGGALEISDTIVVSSEEVIQKEGAVISDLGGVAQVVTVVTSSEERLNQNSIINSLPNVTFAHPFTKAITVSSPQKKRHKSSSKKSKKERKAHQRLSSDEEWTPEKNGRSMVNDVVLQSKLSRNFVKSPIDSHLERRSHPSKSQDSCCSKETREDSFDQFGRYIATLLRDLPSRRSACRLQKEMINWVLKEQMLYED